VERVEVGLRQRKLIARAPMLPEHSPQLACLMVVRITERQDSK
jgi:hypothetical protein